MVEVKINNIGGASIFQWVFLIIVAAIFITTFVLAFMYPNSGVQQNSSLSYRRPLDTTPMISFKL